MICLVVVDSGFSGDVGEKKCGVEGMDVSCEDYVEVLGFSWVWKAWYSIWMRVDGKVRTVL